MRMNKLLLLLRLIPSTWRSILADLISQTESTLDAGRIVVHVAVKVNDKRSRHIGCVCRVVKEAEEHYTNEIPNQDDLSAVASVNPPSSALLTNDGHSINAVATEACRPHIGECLARGLSDEQVILGPSRRVDVRVAQVIVSFIGGGRVRRAQSKGICSNAVVG